MANNNRPRGQVDGMDESSLVVMARGGNMDAWGELIARWEPYIKTSLRQVLKNPEDVNDAFQETVISLTRTIRCISHDNFAGWLRIAMKRRRYTFLRRFAWRVGQAKIESASDCSAMKYLESEEKGPFAACVRAEIASDIRLAVSDLPEKQRVAVEGVMLEEKTREELGKELGITGAAVRRRLLTAKEALRHSLSKHECQEQ